MTVTVHALEVISGPMFSGKTDELIRRLEREVIAGKRVIVFKPAKDTRQLHVVSRAGREFSALEVSSSADINKYVNDADSIGIDEVQFFDEGIVNVALELAHAGKRVICSGLDTDYAEVPFDQVAKLMALATKVTKLSAVCMKCKKKPATRSYRLVDSTDRELVGSHEYEPRCLECFR